MVSKNRRFTFFSKMFLIITGLCLIYQLAYYLEEYMPNKDIKIAEDELLTRMQRGDEHVMKFQQKNSKMLLENMLWKECSSIDIFDNSQITDPKLSRILLVQVLPDLLVVSIQTYSRSGQVKTVGGDLLVVLAIQENGEGRVAGSVEDNGNGTYTGIIQVFWSGLTRVHVKIGAVLQNTCRKLHAMYAYGNAGFSMKAPWGINGEFKLKSAQEKTPCNGNPFIYGYRTLCNFTSLNDGMSWYCGHPKQKILSCHHIYSFGTGIFARNPTTSNEKLFLPTVAVFTDVIKVNTIMSTPKEITNIKCNQRPPIESWKELDLPSTGYWQNKTWRFANCVSTFQHTINNYRTCLRDKTMHIYGDSTLRQYAEYFIRSVMQLDSPTRSIAVGVGRTYHSSKMYRNFGIALKYIKHAMPFHNPDLPPHGMTSFVTGLDQLSRTNIPDEQLIVMINYHTHFQAYPIHVFTERVQKLTVALSGFIAKKPRAKLFLKGFHFIFDDAKWMDNRLTLLYQDIVKQLFADLKYKVIVLDTWSISVAHNSNAIHPLNSTFESQIQQIMTYLC